MTISCYIAHKGGVMTHRPGEEIEMDKEVPNYRGQYEKHHDDEINQPISINYYFKDHVSVSERSAYWGMMFGHD